MGIIKLFTDNGLIEAADGTNIPASFVNTGNCCSLVGRTKTCFFVTTTIFITFFIRSLMLAKSFQRIRSISPFLFSTLRKMNFMEQTK